MRFAASTYIIPELQKSGAKIKAYDPEAMQKSKEILKDVEYCDDPYEVSAGADALVILTEWNEFREIDMGKIRDLLKNPIVIDGRNIYDPEEMRQKGIYYASIGRSDA